MLFCSHFFPSIQYFVQFYKLKPIAINIQERFEKQTYRNRCKIYGPNGVQNLIVPIQNRNHKQLMEEVQIAYNEAWCNKHLQALRTAYASAPYYDYLMDDLVGIYSTKPNKLVELNEMGMAWLLKKLKWTYFTATNINQFDQTINPDHPKAPSDLNFERYYQIFEPKHGFIPNLSMIDLLMHLGPQKAASYLLRH